LKKLPSFGVKAQDAINKEAEHLDRAAHGKLSKVPFWCLLPGVTAGITSNRWEDAVNMLGVFGSNGCNMLE
jgi:hypothetical protein